VGPHQLEGRARSDAVTRSMAWNEGPAPAGPSSYTARRATTSPARQPGARPPAGTWIDSASRPLLAISHEMNELEFHISPARCSSRPHTGVGTKGTRSSSRRDVPGSSVSRRGLSTASLTSGMTPSRQRRSS
jgi:hypothetical protein